MNIEDSVLWRSNHVYQGISEAYVRSRIANFGVELVPVIYDTQKEGILKVIIPSWKSSVSNRRI